MDLGILLRSRHGRAALGCGKAQAAEGFGEGVSGTLRSGGGIAGVWPVGRTACHGIHGQVILETYTARDRQALGDHEGSWAVDIAVMSKTEL